MFGAVCRSTGKVFLQPLKKENVAKNSIAAFLARIRRECPLIQIHLRRSDKTFRPDGVAVVSTDRGGEFTCTNGYTESKVDVLLRDVVHLFNTPGVPQSGTSRIERLWKTLSTAARCHLYTAGLGKQNYFDAMFYAGDVYSDSPTSANKFGEGAAPNASLGLGSYLGVYLPFGSLACHLVRGGKADNKSELVVIHGLNNEGAEYRALRVSDDPGGRCSCPRTSRRTRPWEQRGRSSTRSTRFVTGFGFVRRAALQPRGHLGRRGRGGARWPPREYGGLAG